MASLVSRLKKLEQFEYGGNKLWYIEAIEGEADAWTGYLMLMETGKTLETIKEPMTFDELMTFKEQSDIGVFIDIRNAL